MIPDTTSDAGIDLIKKFEGLHKVMADGMVRSYRCPAGRWTIGYGHVKGVRSGMKVTAQECEDFLRQDLEWVEEAVKKHVKAPLSQLQFDALVCFVFNIGETNFKSSTALKLLNAGRYDDVPEQIMRWNKATVNGEKKELKGLTRRRAAEAAMFTMDEPLASSGGNLMIQKPEASATKPLKKSKTMAGAGAAGVGTAGTAVMDAASQFENLIYYSDTIKYVFLGLTIVGIALVAWSRFKDHKEGVR